MYDSELKDTTEPDYSEDREFIWSVTVYDVLNNKELNKLVESLHLLKYDDYEKEIYLRRKKMKDLQYFRLEINHTGGGILARINFKKHFYFKKLEIKYTQITNQTVAIEYKFSFIKAIEKSERRKFIYDNISNTYFTDFTSQYDNSKIKHTTPSYIHQIERDYLRDIFQGFIVKKLYSNFGKTYKLPLGYTCNYKKDGNKEEEFKNPFLMLSMYNKENDYYILVDIIEKNTLYQFFSNKNIPDIPFLDFFQYFGNEFYYYLFNEIENTELNKKVTKYLLGNYKIVKKKDYLWLVNKLRALRDSNFKPLNDGSEKKKWEVRWSGEIEEKEFFTGDLITQKYTKIYEEYYEYMKTLYSAQNDSIILHVGLLTLISTVVGIIITLVLN
ncbi:hypothetical protein [Planococcus sp. S3-L1]|uniref:hypothetical protein n=1 Tax=Planococcus sp. S3-L1 TaxID=3046200 RepID=UPI0024BB63C7|nr:hypothetical protein [Planococcus sp. S3-L1]MDJ0332281.1 hypothetical protein [Planococcus sp. S3-L1]